MSIVVPELQNVKRKTEARPNKCPCCQGQTFQRWGQVNKPVKDVCVRNVKVYSYRCCHCQRTFRYYPEGNTSADQTERLRLFAVLLWNLGLSYRASSLILSSLKVMVSFMTIWQRVRQYLVQAIPGRCFLQLLTSRFDAQTMHIVISQRINDVFGCDACVLQIKRQVLANHPHKSV